MRRPRPERRGPATAGRPTVLAYAPHSFNGHGPAETCAAIVRHFPTGPARVEVYAARFRRRPGGPAALRPAVRGPRSHLPWRLLAPEALARLDEDFERALQRADPASTVAWFWPDPPAHLVELARGRGIVTVREMINTACATSGPLLDAAYRRLGLATGHAVTDARIAAESAELALYDFCFASNPEVEKSLLRLGIAADKILSTTFGWSPSRFPPAEPRRSPVVRFLFVGSVDVRKGVPELLEAWGRARCDAELVLVGRVAPELATLVGEHERAGRVRAVGFRRDVGRAFHDADVFVFPTLEEGGPQVTYEAAGCGLPVITTPMGAARLVEQDRSGLVVDPGAVDQLAEAVARLADDGDRRAAYGAEARRRADDYTYAKVGPRRHDQLVGLLERAR